MSKTLDDAVVDRVVKEMEFARDTLYDLLERGYIPYASQAEKENYLARCREMDRLIILLQTKTYDEVVDTLMERLQADGRLQKYEIDMLLTAIDIYRSERNR